MQNLFTTRAKRDKPQWKELHYTKVQERREKKRRRLADIESASFALNTADDITLASTFSNDNNIFALKIFFFSAYNPQTKVK